MYYGTKEEQAQVLQKVIAASDIDAEEERIAGEGIFGKAMVTTVITFDLCPTCFQQDAIQELSPGLFFCP